MMLFDAAIALDAPIFIPSLRFIISPAGLRERLTRQPSGDNLQIPLQSPRPPMAVRAMGHAFRGKYSRPTHTAPLRSRRWVGVKSRLGLEGKGAALFCLECGNQTEPNDLYCRSCGKPLVARGMPDGGIYTRKGSGLRPLARILGIIGGILGVIFGAIAMIVGGAGVLFGAEGGGLMVWLGFVAILLAMAGILGGALPHGHPTAAAALMYGTGVLGFVFISSLWILPGTFLIAGGILEVVGRNKTRNPVAAWEQGPTTQHDE